MARNNQFNPRMQEKPKKKKIISTYLKLPTMQDLDNELNKIRTVRLSGGRIGCINLPRWMVGAKVRLVLVE